VKGDVHDIGKNIVGIVLACNNYDVIDLGVMVPAEKIIGEAKKHNVDIIGLSGLITPSLDEMVHVAREMQHEKMNLPLLIGGATTSRIHTAVKIDPEYSGPVVYVLDASRSVPVASELINPDTRANFQSKIKQEYVQLRKDHESRQQAKNYVSLIDARKNKTRIDWASFQSTPPSFLGKKVLLEYALAEIRKYIDWTPFFQTWMLHGRYPGILNDPKVGVEAKKLFDDAQRMLDRMVKEKSVQANGVLAFYPAGATESDDVILYRDDDRKSEVTRLHFLRQQTKKAKDLPNFCLADFVAPAASGKKDYIGMFAVTSGINLEKFLQQFKDDQDDYSDILAKALTDRLAEAFAELLHERVRKEFWGYAKNEKLTMDEVIHEKYEGIRPAPGYPACPDHTEKKTIFELLDAEKETGIRLTESYAMYPASAVSGYYFSHPESKYFGLGNIDRDQVREYALRKGMEVSEIEKWLSPVLAY
jgi:5-methyltetrahydrofolate--homocysteine methyltransferase